ncbi:MAG: hypothetical protein LBE31_09090 [Deltaproteobacteria bacterium]|jgi:hypothetical protein|nr:hypothetical protein [Deltaproteobacteria bacterium]
MSNPADRGQALSGSVEATFEIPALNPLTLGVYNGEGREEILILRTDQHESE